MSKENPWKIDSAIAAVEKSIGSKSKIRPSQIRYLKYLEEVPNSNTNPNQNSNPNLILRFRFRVLLGNKDI